MVGFSILASQRRYFRPSATLAQFSDASATASHRYHRSRGDNEDNSQALIRHRSEEASWLCSQLLSGPLILSGSSGHQPIHIAYFLHGGV